MHHHPPLNQDDWYDMRDWLLENFFQQRYDIVLQQLNNAGLYPEVQTPIFYVNDAYQHGGHVDQSASLTMESLSGTIYYTLDGSDPRRYGHGDILPKPKLQGVCPDDDRCIYGYLEWLFNEISTWCWYFNYIYYL